MLGMLGMPAWRRGLARQPCALQDAHEFLNYLLNECSELLEKAQKAQLGGGAKPPPDPLPLTWIQNLFQVPPKGCVLGRAQGWSQPGRACRQQVPAPRTRCNVRRQPPGQLQRGCRAGDGVRRGRRLRGATVRGAKRGAKRGGGADAPPALQGKLVNMTRCLQCETVTSRQESFFELSLDIEQNASLNSCLRNFWCAPATRMARERGHPARVHACVPARRWPCTAAASTTGRASPAHAAPWAQ